jgi:hypothetical protein
MGKRERTRPAGPEVDKPTSGGESDEAAAVIEVPDVPADAGARPDAESLVVGASPAFREVVERARARLDAGEGISLDELESRLSGPRQRGRPAAGEPFTGRLLLRLPKRLHRELAAQAEREGVSLNQLVVAYLAHQAGQTAAGAATPAGPRSSSGTVT